MIEKLAEKIEEQNRLMPDHPEFRTWMNQSDLWNFLYTAFKIRGERFSKSVVVDMLEGKIREDIPLSMYAFAQSLQNVYKDMRNYIQMETKLTPPMICRWAKMLLGIPSSSDDRDLFRKNEPLVYEWELITPSHEEIPEKLLNIVHDYNREYKKGMLEKASILHLELNRLYAFSEDTALVSLTVLMYSLLEAGYSIPELPLDDREYNKMVADYLESGSIDDFYSMLVRAVYNRHEAIVNLCHQAADIKEWTKI